MLETLSPESTLPAVPASGVAGLAARLQVLAASDVPRDALRPDVLAAAAEALASSREEIRARFFSGELTGTGLVAANTAMTDALILALFSFTTQTVYPRANPTQGERMALVAVGGYGRGELAPHSDIDLLFLLPYKKNAYTEQVIEYILYLLWDLGFKVGQAIRSVDDCMRLGKDDITIRTAMLETRLVAGENPLFESLRQRFRTEIAEGTGPDFVEAKLAERDERHARTGDSRYVLEPNVKEGKGGLRDLHTLFWIAKYIYGVEEISAMVDLGVISAREARRFAKAQNYLWTVRAYLHYLTGREEDRLTFDRQEQVAELMGYADRAGARGVERFMKHYFLYAKEVGDLTRIFCAALEAQHKRRPRLRFPTFGLGQREVDGFLIEQGRLRVSSDSLFRDDPVALLRLFAVAHREQVDIHPATLRLVTRSLPLIDDDLRQDESANRLFIDLLTHERNPEVMLRRMNEAGVFGRFVPDFGRVVGQMQHDMYHVYTVDEHTIRALGILHSIEDGQMTDVMPVASEVVHKLGSRRALYVAVLLHDIAKGRGGDHSEIGADIALQAGPRLGLTEEETETVSWLVRQHLFMSYTALHRDVGDPKTMADFVEVVQSLERLRLLLCLTVADIRAVGPNVWNGWKAALLRELYYGAEDAMSGQLSVRGRSERAEAAKEELQARLPDWSAEAFAQFASRVPAPYWLAFDTDTQLRHAAIVREAKAEDAPLKIDTRVDTFRAITEVTVHTIDDWGLFSRIAGAMALSGANIVDAKVFTLTDGMALDSFWIQNVNGEAFDGSRELRRLKDNLAQIISKQRRLPGRLNLKENRPDRTQVFREQPRVIIDNSASSANTVIEVNGRDRPGFLYDVTTALTELNLQISTAKIATFGTRAVDVFYVKDLFGLKVTHEKRLEAIRERLLEAIGAPDGKPGPKIEAKPKATAPTGDTAAKRKKFRKD
ncbi:MAG: [protein-PII] uridylyltransferase [Alphaproteobacteria bacterium]|nr:[protein-PII] uridylyltransferase [Alphaproteobacteria bacterium]